MSAEEEALVVWPEDNVAVEYHTPTSVVKISRKELSSAAGDVQKLIKNLDVGASKFIGINFDVQQYCVPTLIQGISDGGSAFVYRPDKSSIDICARLNVNLIFSQSPIVGTEILYEFNIHGQRVQLLIYKNLKLLKPQPVQSTNDLNRKFLFAITTSGSTKTPAIVKVSLKCILSNVNDFTHTFEITEKDKIAQLTPLTFDPSIVELLLGLWNNCTLFMASEELKKKPQLLLEKMLESKVTVFQTTPSLLLSRWSRKSLRENLLSLDTSLRILILGGEAFPKMEVLLDIRHRENNTKIFSAYGVTEVSCWASLHEIIPGSINPLETRTDCLGKRLSKTFFTVKSSSGREVKEGKGSLHVGSWDRLCELDAEDFVLNEKLTRPFFRDTGDLVWLDAKGNVFYLGRRDCLIKRFGNKVNLTELEICATSCKLVEKCAVVWNEDEHALHLCVIPVTSADDAVQVKAALRKALESLQEFSRPDEIHVMRDFPLTEHGKVCKRSLVKICTRRMKPRENVEEVMKDLWEEYLGSSEDSGFLSLGGTSMLGLQMSNAVSDVLGVDLREMLTLLLKDSTFRECSAFVLSRIGNKKAEENVPIKDVRKIEHPKNAPGGHAKCSWQKCRGKKYDLLFCSRIENLRILKTYDLKKCIDGSPNIFECSSQIYVTVGSHSGVVCTVALDGSAEYRLQLPDRVEASICVLDNFRAVVGCYDHYVYCFDLRTGEIFWKFKTENSVRSPALACVLADAIFVGSYDHYMYCINYNDGTEIWKTKVSDGSISAQARYNFEKDVLFVGALDGTCAVLERSSGLIIWHRKLPNAIFSSPAVLRNGNVVYCTVDGTLFCFNTTNDTEVWKFSTKLSVFSCLVVHNDPMTNRENICFMAKDYFVRLECDTDTPVLKYKVQLRSHSSCTPWCEGNMVAIADSQGTLYILDFWEGDIVADVQLGGEIFSSPVLHNDRVAVGCRDNKLYVLELLRND